jgi:hypothetical protein
MTLDNLGSLKVSPRYIYHQRCPPLVPTDNTFTNFNLAG